MLKASGIWISGNVPSSKNSKRLVTPKGGNRPLIIHSKTTTRYIKNTKLDWLEQKEVFKKLTKDLKYPVRVGMHFVRGTRHKFDWINMCQIVQDMMVEHQWIEDDNMDFLVPVPFKLQGSYYTYSKENPGVWIVPVSEDLFKKES